jgi:hypothetical protein
MINNMNGITPHGTFFGTTTSPTSPIPISAISSPNAFTPYASMASSSLAIHGKETKASDEPYIPSPVSSSSSSSLSVSSAKEKELVALLNEEGGLSVVDRVVTFKVR